MMPNKFCRYLSNGYSFFSKDRTDVVCKPCCLFRGVPIKLDSEMYSRRQTHYDSISEWTGACNLCETLENVGQQSLRQTGPDWIFDEDLTQDAITIDINLDYECNAACVICNANSSSLWEKENNKLKNIKIKVDKQSQTNQGLIDQIVYQVPLSKVRYVKFFGGEPLFTDTHLRFLREISNPEKTTLHYTTNGSIYPNDDTFEAWKKFKVVIFAASLDGIEDQFDYIRWPLSWNKVSNNLIQLKKDPRANNIIFRVEFTANMLNTFYFDTVENWVNNNWSCNLGGDKTEINLHVYWGQIWNLEFIPDLVRYQILEKYSPDSVIHKLVANLSESKPATDMKQFVEIWEPRRKNSWKLAFPDLNWGDL
jgi:hypothetical protein